MSETENTVPPGLPQRMLCDSGASCRCGKLLVRSGLPKRSEVPLSFRTGCTMPENIEARVITTKLEKDVFWTVPLVDYFLHEKFVLTICRYLPTAFVAGFAVLH